MNRRKFLEHIPGLGLLLFEIKSILLGTFSRVFAAPGEKELKVYPWRRSDIQRIPILWKTGVLYVSATKLSSVLNYHTYFNEEKRKLIIYFPQNKLLLTAGNPFILIDNRAFQMAVECLWENDQIYIPLKYLIPILNSNSNMRFDYDSSAQVLRVFEKNYNITGIEIEEKANGTVVKIRTLLKFKKGEMTLDKRYQWYHVDLYNARADAKFLQRTPLKGLVREIKVIQFDHLLSLAFRLKSDPISAEIYQDKLTNEVVIVWRTNEDIGKADSEQITGEDRSKNEIQSQLEEEKRRWLIDTVVIDAGHGGKDPGAIGKKKLYEKKVVLGVTLKLGKLIEKNMPGVKVVYTRKTDIFIPLRRRTQIANENNGKVFISLHANSSKSKRTNGFETYILGPEKGERAKEVALKENSVIGFEDPSSQKHYEGINVILATMAQSAFMKQSEYLASQVQRGLDNRLKALNLTNRGVKQAPFWVMVGASMPAVLVEIGFITNSYEAKIMKTASYQQKIAEGIFTGLTRFKKDYENAI